uniref:Uncharacterized protein n=1 Tax=Anopheles minimus TaxID=112268 RepID=A0A182VSP6_9DIPT
MMNVSRMLWMHIQSNLIAISLNNKVPSQTLSIAGQIETSDGNLTRDDRVHGGPAIPHHEKELGRREQFDHVRAHL